MRKMFYIIAGTISLLIALFIILTPFTPGSPVFIIFAALCFARVSPKTERWMRKLPWIGERMRSADPETTVAQERLNEGEEGFGTGATDKARADDSEPDVVAGVTDGGAQ